MISWSYNQPKSAWHLTWSCPPSSSSFLIWWALLMKPTGSDCVLILSCSLIFVLLNTAPRAAAWPLYFWTALRCNMTFVLLNTTLRCVWQNFWQFCHVWNAIRQPSVCHQQWQWWTGTWCWSWRQQLPLKGGKITDWQGGVRVNAFSSGGFIPERMRGQITEGCIRVSNWYAILCALAGVESHWLSGREG